MVSRVEPLRLWLDILWLTDGRRLYICEMDVCALLRVCQRQGQEERSSQVQSLPNTKKTIDVEK